jgi:hypothetical protein
MYVHSKYFGYQPLSNMDMDTLYISFFIKIQLLFCKEFQYLISFDVQLNIVQFSFQERYRLRIDNKIFISEWQREVIFNR